MRDARSASVAARSRRGIAIDQPARRGAPAPICCEQRAARAMPTGGGVDVGAALEPRRRLGLQAEPLARPAHRRRLEVRALEHDRRVVAADTSESAPPITPAIACARSRSAMTSMSGVERALDAVERP